MKALKCDICGEYFDGTEIPNRLRMCYQDYCGNINHYMDVDICPECYLAIKKTIEECSEGGSKNARTENG